MPAGSHRFQVGAITCTVLTDGYVSYPTPWFFPDVDHDQLARELESRHLPLESVLSPYTCLLVETGRHVVLVDTGLGQESPTSGAIPARLEMAGVRPKDIDTVVLTHAHPDHIGGAIDSHNPGPPQPMFPNARYILSEREGDFWTASHTDLSALRLPNAVKDAMEFKARSSLAALRHQLEFLDGEAEVVPGLRVIPAPGHTPGHLALLLASDGQQLLNLGDAAVHPLHLEHPEWENGFDLDVGLATTTRRALLDRASADQMHVMAFHFPFPSVGRIAARPDGGWQWAPGW
ncbi:MAG TPA: MBL fold metallo-hydrolase [Bryobacteraceae bacterium]|nr:MBL fold metallo-hydrolase [Bryobacteraceae bacterium]